MNKKIEKIKYKLWLLTLAVSSRLAKNNAFVAEHFKRDEEYLTALNATAKKNNELAKKHDKTRRDIQHLAAQTELPETPENLSDVGRYVEQLSNVKTATRFLADVFSKSMGESIQHKRMQRLDFCMPLEISSKFSEDISKWEIAFRIFSQNRWKLQKTVPMYQIEVAEAIVEFSSVMASFGFECACEPSTLFDNFVKTTYVPVIRQLAAAAKSGKYASKTEFIVQFHTGYESDSISTNPKIEIIFASVVDQTIRPVNLTISFRRPKRVTEKA